MCSSGSSGSARYDPDLLRSDVAHAKNRVARLKQELDEIQHVMQYTRHGVETLSRYSAAGEFWKKHMLLLPDLKYEKLLPSLFKSLLFATENLEFLKRKRLCFHCFVLSVAEVILGKNLNFKFLLP